MSTGVSNIGSTATALSKIEQDRKTIAQNFDAFLGLLTTQLRNQNPLDPLDANQFTQQLVQFSGVEQQLKTNDLLTTISKGFGTSGSGSFNAASAASLIGVQVSADASTTKLTATGDGGHYALYPATIQSNYRNYQVEITNSAGELVYTSPWSPAGTGQQFFAWDGRRNNGTAVDPEDNYTITVVGELETGQKSKMATTYSGIVTAVDLSTADPMVQFGDLSLPLSKIKTVARP